MNNICSSEFLSGLLKELLSLPNETEWVEFKHNNDNPQEIGEYISALSNSAALSDKAFAYLVWGIQVLEFVRWKKPKFEKNST